ncbi:MAG TPA: winged helix-turn-helix domain-containing protein [Candidatus Saccharimonadales bacterium]|nr:winged helix-turn-helix domain-containing protein [Candidatus Saccharimonadales bacterium]
MNKSISALANDYIKAMSQIGAGKPLSKSSQFAMQLGQPTIDWGSNLPPEGNQANPGIGSRILDVLMRPLYGSANAASSLVESIKHPTTANPFEIGAKSFDAAAEGISGRSKKTYANVVDEALPKGWGEGGGTVGETANKAGIGGLIDFISKASEFAGPTKIITGASGLENKDSNTRDLVKGTAGLAGDILLDPSNLIAGGAGKLATAGLKAFKPAAKAAEVADSVAGVSPVKQYWKQIVDPKELEKYKIASDVTSPADTNPTVPAQAIADGIASHAAEPTMPVLGNIERKAAEPTLIDNSIMGKHLSDITTRKSADLAKIDKTRAKRPTWADEINPDEYIASTQVAMDSTHLSPSELARITGLDYKTAMRHIRLMEQDGILETARNTAKAQGVSNAAHSPRKVLTNQLPSELMVNQKPPTVASRAAEMYDSVVPELKTKFDELASQGEKPVITSSDGKNYTLSTADIFAALPRQIVEDYNFGALGGRGAANLYPSQWHAGAAETLRMSELGAAYEPSVRAISTAMQKALRGNASRTKTIASANSIDTVARAMVDNAHNLAQKLTETNKKFGVKDLADGEAVAKTKADDIQNSFEQGTLSDAIDSVANVGNDVSKMAGKIGASNDAAISAIQQVGPMVAKIAPEVDIASARSAKFAENVRKSEGFTPQSDKKIMQRNGRVYLLIERDADSIAREAGIPVLTLGEKPALVMNSYLESLMHPLRNAFEFGYKTGDMADLWRGEFTKAENEGHLFRSTIAKLAKDHGDLINPAYTALRRGVTPSDPAILNAYRDLRSVYEHVLGGGLRGRLFRNGASLNTINAALDEVGLKYKFKPPVKPEDRALVPEQARGWDLKDPLNDLELINKAALLIETRQTVGVSASRLGSNVPKPGYVKLQAGELSKLRESVDTGLFYPREAAEYIQQLDVLIGSATNFQGQKGGIAWFANHIIDPIMQIWKPFMTIARPGHLSRNLWSDIIMSAFRGNMSVRPYRIAAKAMQAAGEFKAVHGPVTDKLSGINKLRGDEVINGADTAFRYKGQPVSYQGFYKMANDEGLIMSWHSTEDILEKTNSFADKMLQNKYMQTMGKANEAEGQFTRLATFQYYLEKGKSVEEAGKLTRATHPDVKGLTPFEQKYMRRIFPFYNWFRQAVPVVLTTMLQKPGRVTGLFKAEHNAAIAMGIDPNSISDPFPIDKLYPSFIRDNIVGPIAGDQAINIGSPQEALLGDTLNGNPGRNVLSMVNPILTAPYEVASRTNVGTGANISDMSDYVDSKIPIVNQVANISGYSVTGLGDPQRQVALGEKQHFFNAQMVNFLTGLGLMDTQKESYRNIATRERNQ